MKTLLILSFLFSVPSYANEAREIHKNDLAPYSGLILDLDKANEVEKQLKERDLFQQIMDSQTKSIELLKKNQDLDDEKVSKLLEQNDKLAESLRSAQSLNGWERVGLVVLGVAVTIGAGIALKAATK